MYSRLSALIRNRNLPDAFWCQNDESAIWGIAALEKRGFRVPEDISVVGFDGCSDPPFGERLTTLSLPFYSLGGAAVDMLCDAAESGMRWCEVPSSLVMKQTLGRVCRNR